MVKEELHEVFEVRMVSDRVMAVVLIFENVLRLICEYALQNTRRWTENNLFMS